ncbi:unnamed protein product [Owenia fusiformis]|uniref:Uncharacterized protein n=1 Tax=Owenia fusiformis TaxID=6347 RepID=A0A8S4P691_OWEFU|nr:unnamed protein product [Owenia fusiformis]
MCASLFVLLVVLSVVSAELNAADSIEKIEKDFEDRWGKDKPEVKTCDDCKETQESQIIQRSTNKRVPERLNYTVERPNLKLKYSHHSKFIKMNKMYASMFVLLVVLCLVSARKKLNAAESSEEIESDFEGNWGVDNEKVKTCDDCKNYGSDTTYLRNLDYRMKKHKFYKNCHDKLCSSKQE